MERFAARITLLWGWRRAVVAFLAGSLLVLALAPFDFLAAGFVSFPILVWLMDGATGEPRAGFFGRLRPAFATGWWFGFGYFVAGLWWIGNALLVEAEAFAWALPFAIVGLPAVLALFYAFATALARIWWRDGPSRIGALAICFTIAELARANLFTGFPWNPIGFTIAPVPMLMQSVSVIGITGLNTLAVFVLAIPAILVSGRFSKTGLATALILACLHVGYGAIRLALPMSNSGETLAVRIVQPSIKQTEKWDNERRNEIFTTLLELTVKPVSTDQETPELVIWPESAVPFLFTERPDGLSAIGNALEADQTLMTGAVRLEGGSSTAAGLRVYNSILTINSDGEIVNAADKLHLVPFGEYLPFSEQLSELGLSRLVEGPGAFKPGSTLSPLKLPDGRTALPFICYEIIFSDPALWIDGASFVINVTNDAWYGRTPGPYQHLRHSQLRAVELGLPVIRAANNGVSAAINHHGEIIDGLDLDVRSVLDVKLPMEAANTQYMTARGMFGYALCFLIALFSLITGYSAGYRAD